jgi:hypothetical protein
MFVLLNAEAIVKPPMSNIIVGENMAENMNLQGMLVKLKNIVRC